jgi:5-hydroxyisourate hydrolase-like protein (transthyretin family)
MSGWVEAFIVVAAVAIVIQSVMLVTLVATMRRTFEQLTKVSTDLQTRLDPILIRSNRILEDAETRVASVMADAAEITRLAREQVLKVDQVFTDATDRLRVQVARADQIVTGTLELVEETGTKVRKTVWEPVNQISAVIKGIKVGLNFLRNHRQNADPDSIQQDEELFI